MGSFSVSGPSFEGMVIAEGLPDFRPIGGGGRGGKMFNGLRIAILRPAQFREVFARAPPAGHCLKRRLIRGVGIVPTTSLKIELAELEMTPRNRTLLRRGHIPDGCKRGEEMFAGFFATAPLEREPCEPGFRDDRARVKFDEFVDDLSSAFEVAEFKRGIREERERAGVGRLDEAQLPCAVTGFRESMPRKIHPGLEEETRRIQLRCD